MEITEQTWASRLVADMNRAHMRRMQRRCRMLAAVVVVLGVGLCAVVVRAAYAGASYSCSFAPTGLPAADGRVELRYSPPDGIARTLWDATGPRTMQAGATVVVTPIDGTHVFYPTLTEEDRTEIATLVALCLPAVSTTAPAPTTAPTTVPLPPVTAPATTTPVATTPPAVSSTTQPELVCPAGSYLTVRFSEFPADDPATGLREPATAVVVLNGEAVSVASAIPVWVAVFPFAVDTAVSLGRVDGVATVECGWITAQTVSRPVPVVSAELPVTGFRSVVLVVGAVVLTLVGVALVVVVERQFD